MSTFLIDLGINVDHVATIRQARLIDQPDPVEAALIAEGAGADLITVHLREDRRHIQDRDVRLLRELVKTRLNLEMGLAEEIQSIALDVLPDVVTLVPERREELTTEGGLDVLREHSRIEGFLKECHARGIEVSLFIDPDSIQVEAAHRLGADAVELHTGRYAEVFRTKEAAWFELERLNEAGRVANEAGMRLVAGHGLNERNISLLCEEVEDLDEVNIGHAIVGRAIFTGLADAVAKMRALIP